MQLYDQQGLNLFITLIAISNPIGILAIFISLVDGQTRKQQYQTIFTMTIAIIVILFTSIWFGTDVLNLFGISLSAFQVAGGILIASIGLSMAQTKTSKVQYTRREHSVAKTKNRIAVIPLAMPLLAGPGAITATIVAAKGASIGDQIRMSIACAFLAVVIAVTFMSAPCIAKVLGESGIKITTRVMGLILLAMAVVMLQAGLIELFPCLS